MQHLDSFLLSISIILNRSSRWHPVSAQNWCILDFAGIPTLLYPCKESTGELHLWVCPYFSNSAQHVSFRWFARWEVSGHTAAVLSGWCFKELFKAVCNILMQFQFSFSSKHFAEVQVVQPYNSTKTATTWKNSDFILSERLGFHMVDNMSIAVLCIWWHHFQ